MDMGGFCLQCLYLLLFSKILYQSDMFIYLHIYKMKYSFTRLLMFKMYMNVLAAM